MDIKYDAVHLFLITEHEHFPNLIHLLDYWTGLCSGSVLIGGLKKLFIMAT